MPMAGARPIWFTVGLPGASAAAPAALAGGNSMRLASLCVAGMLALLACAPPAARADTEVLVPFDAAGRVQRVDEPLARRLGLWVDEHPGFFEARLFAVGDSSFVLEISVLSGGRLERRREPLTPAQADALRADFASRLAAAGPPPEKLNQDGRTMLVAGNAMLGLGFYGWAVPFAFDADDASVWVGGYLLTAGASSLVPMMLTQNVPVSWPTASLSLYGSSRGIWHGWLLADLASPDGSDSDDDRGRVAVMMATSVAEGFAGYAIARRGHMRGGTVQTIANGGDYGLLWGACVSDAAGFADRPTAFSMLAATTGGMLAFGLLDSRRAYSYGDAWVMRSAGYVGMLVATTVADAGEPEGSEAYSVAIVAGSLAGLAVGDRLVEGREFTGGDGILVQLGGSAGALMGLGLVALATPNGPRASTAYWGGAAAGATVGWGLSWRALADRAAGRAVEGASWRFELDPRGVAAALARPGSDAAEGRAARAVPVAARVTCAF